MPVNDLIFFWTCGSLERVKIVVFLLNEKKAVRRPSQRSSDSIRSSRTIKKTKTTAERKSGLLLHRHVLGSTSLGTRRYSIISQPASTFNDIPGGTYT